MLANSNFSSGTPPSSAVRVRYAPSPTGPLHVGGVRTLLHNYLFAKKTGGTLIIRIEDTDQQRSTPEHEAALLHDIKTLGLMGDETPESPGAFGPYRQSERLSIYADYVNALLNNDKAYHCFCPAEMIAEKREAALKLGKTPSYDGTCAKISRAEREARLNSGEKAGVRFRAPHQDVVLQDEVRGEITFKAGSVGDFLITRTPRPEEAHLGIGMPVYNFCCVIDDHLMQMSHVIRGEDHLANTARQLMIYDAFQWNRPLFAHTPMVQGSDRQKLSKRNGDTSARDYLAQGYLKEALLNFLTYLGWAPKSPPQSASGNAEILTLVELAQAFSIEGLQKAPAVFDLDKLRWMNAQHLKLTPGLELANQTESFFTRSEIPGLTEAYREKNPEFHARVMDNIKLECTLLTEFPEKSALFYRPNPALQPEARSFLVSEEGEKIHQLLMTQLQNTSETLDVAHFERIQKSIAETLGIKGKALFMPIRAWITGQTHGPEIKTLVSVLGRTETLRRIDHHRSLI